MAAVGPAVLLASEGVSCKQENAYGHSPQVDTAPCSRDGDSTKPNRTSYSDEIPPRKDGASSCALVAADEASGSGETSRSQEEQVAGQRSPHGLENGVASCNGHESAETDTPSATVPCDDHGDPLLYFCEDCDKLVCASCTRGSHAEHSYEEAARILPDHLADLKDFLQPAQELVSRAETAVKQLEQDDEAIESNRKLCADNVREVFNLLRSALDERERLLLSTIDHYVDSKLLQVRRQKEKLNNGRERIVEATGTIQRLIGQPDNVLILHEEQLIVDELDFQQECVMDAENEMQDSKYSSTYVGFREENVKATKAGFAKIIALCEFFPDADSGYYCSRDIIIEGENPYFEVSRKGASNHRVRFRRSFRSLRRNSSSLSGRMRSNAYSSIPEEETPTADNDFLPHYRKQSISSNTSYVSTISSDSEDSLDMEQPPIPPIRFGSLITPSPIIEPVKVLDKLSRSKQERVFPCGVCTGMKDNLVISDVRNNCLRLLASNGKFIDTIGKEGRGSGEFEDPSGIAVDSKNHILVAQRENPRIQRFTSAGKCVRKILQRSLKGNMMGEPWALAISPSDGNIYVSDWDKSCIHVFQPSGKLSHSLGLDKGSDLADSLQHPAGLTFDTQGRLLVTDRVSHCVWMLEQDGSIHSKFGGKGHGPGDLYYPYGIATDRQSGCIFVTESGNNRVSVFSATGGFLRSFGRRGSEPGMFDHPRHLCINSRGEIIVADEGNQRLQVFKLLE